MSTETIAAAAEKTAADRVFGRVIVGIDDSPESREAARQASILAGTDGDVMLLAAWNVTPPAVTAPVPVTVTLDTEAARETAKNALRHARKHVLALATGRAKVVQGVGWVALLDEAAADEASLVVVGSHGQGRLEGIVVGSTATEVVHKAPCSVLVARPAGADFPHRIVVGVDGSPESAYAYATAAELATRFDAELWPVTAEDGKGVDRAAVVDLLGHRFELSPDEPVGAIVTAASEADLVVVGSRGLHGLASLGSVSERVAHRARCSTLVVRPPAVARAGEEIAA